jgi:hypothetical protein
MFIVCQGHVKRDVTRKIQLCHLCVCVCVRARVFCWHLWYRPPASLVPHDVSAMSVLVLDM